jgi:hypothetical protein
MSVYLKDIQSDRPVKLVLGRRGFARKKFVGIAYRTSAKLSLVSNIKGTNNCFS